MSTCFILYNNLFFLTVFNQALVAEWSKALRSGRSLFGGAGSSPVQSIFCFLLTYCLFAVFPIFTFLFSFASFYYLVLCCRISLTFKFMKSLSFALAVCYFFFKGNWVRFPVSS